MGSEFTKSQKTGITADRYSFFPWDNGSFNGVLASTHVHLYDFKLEDSRIGSVRKSRAIQTWTSWLGTNASTCCSPAITEDYKRIPGHKNCSLELGRFLHCALETAGSDLGIFLLIYMNSLFTNPSTNGLIPDFLVLPGSESTITEITEYMYFSPLLTNGC